MNETTRNPMNAWVCCGAAITGPHSIGCIYGKPMPPPTPPRGTGEEAPPSDSLSARQPGDPCDCGVVWAELTRLRARLAAVEGERDAAERRGAERALEWAASNPAGFPVQFRGLPVTWNAADETVPMYQKRGLATLFPEAPDART